MAPTKKTKTTQSTIGQAVHDRRTHLGLTQADAALEAGISRRAWSEVELGQRRGSEETLTQMERVLGLEPGALVALDPDPNGDLAKLKRELVAMIKGLTTREELQEAHLELTRARFNRMKARLDELEALDARRARENADRAAGDH